VAVTDPSDTILEKLNPEVRVLVQELRALIKEVMPRSTEKAHLGWNAWHYRAGATVKDIVVAISPQRAYAKLEFGDGVDLPDPQHRLEGTGKRLRHVKIRRAEDVADPDVRNLLETAGRRRGV
jgi:hypothetical protein